MPLVIAGLLVSVMIVALGASWRARAVLVPRRLAPWEVPAIGAVLGLWTTWLVTTVHHGVWHTMTHGLERLADARDGAFPVNLQELHGPGWWLLVGLPAGWLEGWVDATSISAAWLGAGLVFLWLAAREHSQDPATALLTLAAMAGAAPVLRLAPTVSLYVPAVTLLLASWWAWEVWLDRPRPAVLVLASATLAGAMLTRADLLAVGPAFVLLRVIAFDPRRLLDLGSLRRLACWGPFAVVVAARALDLWLTGEHRSSRATPPGLPGATEAWLAWGLASGLLLCGRAPDHRRWRQVLGPLVTGAATVLLVVVAWTRMPGPITDGLGLHPALQPGYAGPLTVPLVLAGLVAMLDAHPRRAAWLAPVLVLTSLLYLSTADSASTWIRTSLVAFPAWSLVAATGARALLGALRTPASASIGVALLLVAQPWTHRDWLAHAYPRQVEHDVLSRARAHLLAHADEDTTVALLTVEDVPAGVDPSLYPQLQRRAGVARFLGGRNVHRMDPYGRRAPGRGEEPWTLLSASEALSADEPPDYWLHPLACHRLLMRITRDVEVVEGEEQPVSTFVSAVHVRPEVDPASLARVTAREVTDPLCRRADARFAGRPVVTGAFPPGGIGNDTERVWGPGATLGLYRPEPASPP